MCVFEVQIKKKPTPNQAAQLVTVTKRCQLSPSIFVLTYPYWAAFRLVFKIFLPPPTSLWPIVTSQQGVHFRALVYLYIIQPASWLTYTVLDYSWISFYYHSRLTLKNLVAQNLRLQKSVLKKNTACFEIRKKYSFHTFFLKFISYTTSLFTFGLFILFALFIKRLINQTRSGSLHFCIGFVLINNSTRNV